MSQDLRQEMGLRQRLSQQQLRFVRMLELTAPELEQAVEQELLSNPALTHEEQSSDREETPETFPLARYYPSSQKEVAPDIPLAEDQENLYDFLHTQIDELPVDSYLARAAHYIVGNIDSNGYLLRPIDNMVDDALFQGELDATPEVMAKALEVVRGLEPAGVGASDLRDTLMLQLSRLPASEERDDALNILQNRFEDFANRRSHRIQTSLKLNKQRIEAANALILTLNPKPGSAYSVLREERAAVVRPDVVVWNSGVAGEGDNLMIELANRLPELAVAESFSEAMRGMEHRRGRPRKGTEFVVARYNEARDFINVLRQRQSTVMDVATAIVSLQKPFFLSGDVYDMRPMMIKDITALTGLDASVISRATSNKHIQMPWGEVRPMRSFFSDKVNQPKNADHRPVEADGASVHSGEEDTEALTNRQIEASIRSLVEGEDKAHPLSDEKLREALAGRGYDVSRRTVAKYRDRLGILVARLRKKL